MEQPIFDDRLPSWERTELWSRAAASDRLRPPAENEAVPLMPEEEMLRGLPNCYTLWLGPQSLLHGLGRDVFAEIRRQLKFDSQHEWGRQKLSLQRIFRHFFTENSAGVGSVSFAPIRRPAHWRALQDPTIKITQDLAEPSFYKREVLQKDFLQIGTAKLPIQGLRFACAKETSQTATIARTIVRRQVYSSKFNLSERTYREHWYCMAQRDYDNKRLIAGQIPAVSEQAYGAQRLRVRTTAMLSLVKISPNLLMHQFLVVEVDPGSGLILSLRWIRSPLAVAMLCSPSEHRGVCEVLSRFEK